MAVPCGARAWREAHRVGPHAGVVLVAYDDVEPHVAGEQLRRPFDSRLLGLDFHVGLLSSWIADARPDEATSAVAGLQETRRTVVGTSLASSSPPASLGSGSRIRESFRWLQL